MERVIAAGIAAAKGIAIGKAFVYAPASVDSSRAFSGADAERKRLDDAIEGAREQIRGLAAKARESAGENGAAILETQLTLLQDPALIDQAVELIGSESMTAEAAIARASEEIAEMFDAMEDDPYIRERAADIRDIGRRVGSVLTGEETFDLSALPAGTVLVARDLKPSETVQIDRKNVTAFLTDIGGPTSHSAIIARAMGIVCVVGMGTITASIETGDTLVVDADEGRVIIDPTPGTLETYRARKAAADAERARLRELIGKPTRTRAGKSVVLAANIGSLAEADAALENGAEAIGLFRTEFLFMDRAALPSENEQYQTYKAVAEKMAGKPVIVRTLDIGGDKTLPYLPLPREENPFLGVRAIRLCFKELGLFKTQLRAILRAGVHGDLKIMFPMIGAAAELDRAKAILEDCEKELRAEGTSFKEETEVGVMIEIPAAVLVADELASRCAFFSIGTNDLTQYALAVDRMNAEIADLYDPTHPAVLRLIRMAIDAAHARGIPCGMCGELAGKTEAIPLLLEYGLDEFSMGASRLLEAKRVILES